MNSTSIYLDTHVIIWLYVDERNKLSNFAQSIISKNYDLICSPLVKLELQYLYEIGRITDSPDVILTDLADRIGLHLCDKSFSAIINCALSMYMDSWRFRSPHRRKRNGQRKYPTEQGSQNPRKLHPCEMGRITNYLITNYEWGNYDFDCIANKETLQTYPLVIRNS